jgi:hypothetical protein
MKKILSIVAVVLVAVVIFGAGFAFAVYQPALAQNASPILTGATGFGPMMGGRGGYGVMHNYVELALADKLGMTEAQIEEQLSAGKTMFQIAVDKGTAAADVPALLEAVHKTAFDKAVAAGVMTQTQADAMFKQMQAAGFSSNLGTRPQDGTGFGRGMMGGGRGGRQGGMMDGQGGMMRGWGQQAPQTNP